MTEVKRSGQRLCRPLNKRTCDVKMYKKKKALADIELEFCALPQSMKRDSVSLNKCWENLAVIY